MSGIANRNGKRVVIVGGGISGLSAALKLKDSGFRAATTSDFLAQDRLAGDDIDSIGSFIVLEANGRVGGRTCSEYIKTSLGTVRSDLGGAYLGPDQDRILNLCQRFKLTLFKVNLLDPVKSLF